MLDKETSMMTYRAWRHNLPVRVASQDEQVVSTGGVGAATHAHP